MLDGTNWFPILLLLIGIAVAVLMVVVIVKCVRGMRRWRQIEASPVESYAAVVREKQVIERAHHVLSHSDVSSFGTETDRQYQVVFQLEDGGERLLEVPEAVYALLAEGDDGILTIQGEHFLQFERNG